ncbi:MAG: hypothetical protein IJW18_06195 [Lachnospiraceae bacterium]|nr:hypothetical protein [Lachnospiraceae bacterium]
MKKKLTNNLFLKILSVLFAIMFWLVVAIVADPYKTVTISGVPITILNEEEITEQGLGQLYSVVSPQDSTVSIKVYGQRSKVDRLKASDITATVNFGEISSVGAVYIQIKDIEGVTVLSKSSDMMKIDIEPIVEKEFPVELKVVGEAGTGYMINSYNVSPEVIKVTAPESIMAKLARAQVLVDVSDTTTDIDTTAKVALYDASGKLLDYEREAHMKLSEKMAGIKVDTLMTKEVEIVLGVSGTPAEDYKFTGATASAETILLKGKEEILSEINNITISKESGALSLTGLSDTREVIVDMTEFLPEGVTFVNDNDKMVTVKLMIEPILERTLTVTYEQMQKLNLAEGLEIVTDEETGMVSIDITIRGLEKNVTGVTVETLKPYINLNGCSVGESSLRVYLTMPAGVELVGTPRITVLIQEHIEEPVEEPIEDVTSENTQENTQ